MKTLKRATPLVALTLALCVPNAFGVVDQAITVQETNLVLSWPSTGNEIYLVQYRPTLDPSTPWLQLTNAYRANSTNRTTYVIPCCKLVELAGTNLMSLMGSPGESLMVESVFDPDALRLWAMPSDGSGSPVPLAIYPPGVPTNHLMIFEATTSEMTASRQSKQGKKVYQEKTEGENYEAMRISNGGCDCPDMGFFRVFHIPDFPASITNYVFDGPIFIPVNFKDYLDRVENIEVLFDNAPTDLAEFITLDGTNWGMGIYFDRIANGTHQIQLRSTLRLTDEVSDDTTPLLVLTNLVRSITVDNEVTFTNWDDLIWNTTNYTFKAQLKNPDTDWWIDILDAWGNYVNGTSGHTTNGIVEWTWDLTDTASNLRDSLESDPFFDPYITFESAPSVGPTAAAPTTRRTPIPMVAYPNVGRWIFTYADEFYEPGTRRDIYLAGVGNLAGGPALRNIPASTIPVKYGTNYTQADRNNSWFDLRASMFSPDARNFYYYGHGWATGIGGDVHTYSNNVVTGGKTLPGSKAYLTTKQVRDEITHNKHAGARPYRFVWLDGCSTANGDWPDAFGINKATNSLSFYTNSVSNPSRKRPSAFIGWNRTIGGQGWGTLQGFWNARTQWIFRWQQNWNTEELMDALEYGRNTSNWIPSGQFWDAIRVFGYTRIRMNEYNQKTDWPAP